MTRIVAAVWSALVGIVTPAAAQHEHHGVPAARALLPARLAGQWREADGDLEALAKLVGTSSQDVVREFARLRLAKRSFDPRFSVYALRHTMATLDYLDGMDLGSLSRRLGHSDYAFTFKRYARGVNASHTAAVAENTQRRWRAAGSALKLIA